MKNKISQVKIESLNMFIKYLEENSPSGIVLFRGQPDDDSLLPKIARGGKFRWKKDLLKTECEMFEEFKKRSLPYLDFKPASDWDWLALAQHYGLATRLLDWTKNPLAALWFVVSNSEREKNKGYGVIWMFSVMSEHIVDANDKISPFECDSTKVFQPNHITKRIVAQDGWFTVHKYVNSARKFIRFEKLKKYSQLLTKMIVPYDAFYTIRNQLNQCGINSASIFPDLDGLCKHIVWDNSCKVNELESIKDALHFEEEALKAIVTPGKGFCPTHHLKTQVSFSVGGNRMIIDAVLDGPKHLFVIEVKNSTKKSILTHARNTLMNLSKQYETYLKSQGKEYSLRPFIIAPNYDGDLSASVGIPILKYDKDSKQFVNKDYIYRWIFGETKILHK